MGRAGNHTWRSGWQVRYRLDLQLRRLNRSPTHTTAPAHSPQRERTGAPYFGPSSAHAVRLWTTTSSHRPTLDHILHKNATLFAIIWAENGPNSFILLRIWSKLQGLALECDSPCLSNSITVSQKTMRSSLHPQAPRHYKFPSHKRQPHKVN